LFALLPLPSLPSRYTVAPSHSGLPLPHDPRICGRRDTANSGLTAFNRYFYAQIGKQAAIVDERFNGGGLLATDIAEILNRKPLSAAANRVGSDIVQPQGIFGPKVMLINERAGSGGDAMPWYFKRAGVGKLVGPGPGAAWSAWREARRSWTEVS
jgi:hypothetical protein